MRHHFQTEQWLSFGREQAFAFFADPANLPPLMPGWQRARVERANYVSPPEMPTSGKIVAFRWGDYFCDEQRRGPFKYFHHCHRVRDEVRDGVPGSVVSDVVEYELPLGMLGDLANGLAVRRQIRSLFMHRQRMLPVLLSAAQP
jgi:ligand-binding SRPBCC domain-containing protein